MLANCSFCLKEFGFRENKYQYPDVGLEFCFDCMACSICDYKHPKFNGGILGMQPLCRPHYDKYSKILLHLLNITEWPEEIVNARLKYLYRVRDRDTKLLSRLEEAQGSKIEGICETIALLGRNFKGVSRLKVSEIKSQDRLSTLREVMNADLQDCLRQISEIEALKQNGNATAIEESRRLAEGLDPNKNRSIDEKEFLAGKIIELPEPYLIVRDSPLATFQNIMGITFNNLAEVINILARKHNYRIISTACDNHTMYVFMEKMGSLR